MIRIFKEKDADELSEMINKVVDKMEKSYPEFDYTLIKEENKPNELIRASREGKMWIAKVTGKIVGTISLMDNRLRRFFVRPDYQRRGMGRSLVDSVISYAKSCKIKNIKVNAIVSAIPVYKKLGFQEGKIFLNREINQKEMRMKLIL